MWLAALLVLLFEVAHGHMGISISQPSTLKSRDFSVGDAYRYPNYGHCHGVAPGAVQQTYKPGDTLTLLHSNGAAHDGGHCALFLASKNTQPTERVWYKQKDELDCTLKGTFDWKIDSTLVPPECATGCTLIWAWTPKSSGACEIYMNCFDIAIEDDGSNTASTVQIERGASGTIPCSRVDGAGKTPSYGTFCGDSCATIAGGGTQPPTLAPGGSLAPTASPANPPRCGSSWPDANEKCLGACQNDGDCSGLKCYADMIRLCTTITAAPTAAGGARQPSMSPIQPSIYRATPNWAATPGMDQWCASNCPTVCPESHCTKNDTSVQPLNPNQGVYEPECKKVTISQMDTPATLETIVVKYDLAAAGNVPTELATYNLFFFNYQCNPSLQPLNETGQWPELPVGTSIYLTGDCELLQECQPPNSVSRLAINGLALWISFGLFSW